MGEVVVSREDMVSMEADAPRNHSGESCRGVVNWERFLPRRVLRVLLIEADDSTRQIIAALLRKCCYKVIAVPDGLKAWEILKGRPRAIDFILTEVDLPSISGFALLTLIMEHDVCKKIPVIMMSSKDSISTVYKCMTRGAADYLVKPVRINELKNLWQHVWRRQMVNLTNGQQHETAAMQKVEATAENDAASNLSSGNGDKELTEKESNAQSSCTKPDMDPDIAEIEQNPDYNVNEMKTLMPEAVRSSDAKVTTVASDCNDMTIDSYREAINLIGAFDNSPRSIYMDYSWNYGTKQSDEQPELGLSLRQFDASCITNQKYELKHSDASAFSRYVTKPLGSPQSGSVNLQDQDQDQEFARITDNPQERVCPAPILVRGIRFDSYGSQTGPSPTPTPTPTPGTTTRLEPLLRFDSSQQSSCENNNFDRCSDPHDQNASNSSNQYQIRQVPDLKFEPFEERGQISPATDGSASSSVCNGGSVTHLNSMDSGSVCASNGNVNQVPDTSQRSIQREAALAKFRLKRKDRCFEKKVRYESRKKLAEKRPRVKGQFVRQFALEETNL